MGLRYDLKIDQGADFSESIEIFDENGDPDANTYVAQSKMRKFYTSNNFYEFSCNVDSGIILMQMNAAVTAAIVPGRYVYDVELSSNTTTTRILEGIVTVTPSATY